LPVDPSLPPLLAAMARLLDRAVGLPLAVLPTQLLGPVVEPAVPVMGKVLAVALARD